MITSLHNRAVREVTALLGKKKERDRQSLFVVEGGKMFGEAPAERISRGISRREQRRKCMRGMGISCLGFHVRLWRTRYSLKCQTQ